MATAAPPDVELTPIDGEPRPLRAWLTTFHLVLVAVDPFTNESAWLIDTAGRILRTFTGADCRVAWLVTGTSEEARLFLGTWADELLTFADPEREAVKALEVERLPAFVHIDHDLTLVGRAEGWDPEEWRGAAQELATIMSWRAPRIPDVGDPGRFEGTPALG